MRLWIAALAGERRDPIHEPVHFLGRQAGHTLELMLLLAYWRFATRDG